MYRDIVPLLRASSIMAEDSAERSAIEVKHLLRKLHPKSGSHHKDRVRLLNRFRNYATGAGGKGPVSPFAASVGIVCHLQPLLLTGSWEIFFCFGETIKAGLVHNTSL